MSSLADQLGEIIFRVETNIEYLRKRVLDGGIYSAHVEEAFDYFYTDIERLKQLKIILDNP